MKGLAGIVAEVYVAVVLVGVSRSSVYKSFSIGPLSFGEGVAFGLVCYSGGNCMSRWDDGTWLLEFTASLLVVKKCIYVCDVHHIHSFCAWAL